MTSFPHSLVFDLQPHFGLTPSEFLKFKIYNFLLNWLILMKNDTKCLASLRLSYKVHVKVCNPILSVGSVSASYTSCPLN